VKSCFPEDLLLVLPSRNMMAESRVSCQDKFPRCKQLGIALQLATKMMAHSKGARDLPLAASWVRSSQKRSRILPAGSLRGVSHPHLHPLPSRERDAYTEVQEETSCRGFGEPVSKPFVPVKIETQDYEWG